MVLLIRQSGAPADAALTSKPVKKRNTDPGVRVQVSRIASICCFTGLDLVPELRFY